jgi:site-specific DNA-methyltransferase (adenine-specific)
MIYDFLEDKFLEEDEKLHNKVDIYTGHGSPYEIQIGDCEVLLKDIKDNSIHTIITDPPYGVGMHKDWDKDMPEISVWEACYRVLKPGSHIAVFCQPSMLPELIHRMSTTRFEFRDQIIWTYQGTHIKGVRTNDDAYGSKIRNTYNPILLYRKPLVDSELYNWELYRTNLLNLEATRQAYKGDHSSIVKRFEETGEMHYQSETKSNTYGDLDRKGWVPNARGSLATNVQHCPRATKEEKTCNGQIENTHISVKPVALMLWLVKLLTNSPNQTVLDIYAGTGSTGIACRKNNTRFIGMEKDPGSAEVAKLRIKYTFDLDGKYFDKVRPV